MKNDLRRSRIAMVIVGLAVAGAGAFLKVRTRPERKPLVITMPTRRPADADLVWLFPGDSRQVFERSDRFILYSLDPTLASEASETFHRFRVVGKMEIKDPKIRRALIAHFYNGLADEIHPAGCFNPHHAIRATRGNKSIDLVMCFGCSGVFSYYGQKTGEGAVSPAPAHFFNAVLESGGVPH